MRFLASRGRVRVPPRKGRARWERTLRGCDLARARTARQRRAARGARAPPMPKLGACAAKQRDAALDGAPDQSPGVPPRALGARSGAGSAPPLFAPRSQALPSDPSPVWRHPDPKATREMNGRDDVRGTQLRALGGHFRRPSLGGTAEPGSRSLACGRKRRNRSPAAPPRRQARVRAPRDGLAQNAQLQARVSWERDGARAIRTTQPRSTLGVRNPGPAFAIRPWCSSESWADDALKGVDARSRAAEARNQRAATSRADARARSDRRSAQRCRRCSRVQALPLSKAAPILLGRLLCRRSGPRARQRVPYRTHAVSVRSRERRGGARERRARADAPRTPRAMQTFPSPPYRARR